MASASNTYLLYHAIFSTKKRERILQKHIRSDLFAFMGGIIKEIGGMPVLINGIEDHVHILAFFPKHVSISDVMHSIKGRSSHWFNQNYHMPLNKLNWQEGYHIYTVSGSNLDAVKNYIFNQEEHHRVKDFDQEMMDIETKMKHFYSGIGVEPGS